MTTPEMIVRRLLHRLGHRFRLHRRDLPGTPDVVLARSRVVINVNGCFWHCHTCRHGRRPPPVRNAAYWAAKRAGNVARDARNRRRLKRLGWRVLVIWECQTRDANRLANRVAAFFGR